MPLTQTIVTRIALPLLAVCLARAACGAEPPGEEGDWPQWRGPQRDGVSRESGLLREWPDGGPSVVWEVEHVGDGFSSLAVGGGRIFTLGNLDGIEHVVCLDAADGSVVWTARPKAAERRLKRQVEEALARLDADGDGTLDRTEVGDDKALADFDALDASADGRLAAAELRRAFGGFHDDMGAGPRSTPAIDGDALFTLGCMGDLACLDRATGSTRWSLNLIDDFSGSHTGRGYSESPLVDGNLLIVSPNGEAGAVAALEKSSGKLAWRSSEVDERIQYASAVAADIAGERTIVHFSSRGLLGLRARDGRLLWRYDRVSSGVANVCTPLVWRDHVFAASGYNTGAGLVRIVRDGDAWRADEVYFNSRLANHHGGVVRVGDYVYGTGSNSLIAMNFLSGEVAWIDRGVGKGALIAADGMLYLLGESHQMALAEASPEAYRERGRFELPDLGRPTWTHPVVAGGRLYLRNQQRLTAYDVRESANEGQWATGGQRRGAGGER